MGFVPRDVEVPELLEHDRLRVRPLTVHFGGIDLLRARDGRLAEHRVSSDGLQRMAQLGALGPGA
jgi:hypothetical protein